MRYYSNVAVLTTLSNVGGISTGATEITPTSTTGFPSQYPYTLRLEPDTSNEELVTVTGPKSGAPGTLVITRASDGTTAKTHAAGSTIVHGVSARDFQEPQDHIASVAVGSVHGLPDTAWEDEVTIHKGVDQGYNLDSTLNDDTVLKFTADANSKYRVDLYCMVSGLNGNVKLAWKVPAGATGMRGVIGPALLSLTRDDTNVRIGAHGFATEVPYGLNSDIYFACIRENFVITTGATAGPVVLQHAQNTSGSDQTIVRASSWMVVRKLQ